jgi:SAM-dependent methyltransferase
MRLLLGRLAARLRRPAENATAAGVAPVVEWPTAADSRRCRCPNCGARGGKPLLLSVRFTRPGGRPQLLGLRRCPACTAAFYEKRRLPDYKAAELSGGGRTAFYLQQGAGLSALIDPLAGLLRPPGSRYLEVGCGFGFSLDFAIRGKGFLGQGIDPGLVAKEGGSALGVPIARRYLGRHEWRLRRRFDVVMAAETLEHVPRPEAFARTLRHLLRPGGVLVLTTPDGEALTPKTAPGELVGLLSPGLHLVLQTAASLRALLLRAGFRAIVLRREGAALVAYAGETEEALLTDPAARRRAYRAYLEERAAQVPASGDLGLGLAGRAFWEAVNDGDLATADRFAGRLRAACRQRFGLDLASMTALPAEAAHCDLERLAALMPLGLGVLLYADCLRHLLAGAPRAPLAARLRLAAQAADTLRRATRRLAMEDALSEDIAWTARAEALLCDAAAGEATLARQAAALPPAPGQAQRRMHYLARALTEVVNAGRYQLGMELAASSGLQDAPWAEGAAPPADAVERDALFCLSVLDVQPLTGAEPQRGARRFAAVCAAAAAAGERDSPLWRAAAAGMRQAEAIGKGGDGR